MSRIVPLTRPLPHPPRASFPTHRPHRFVAPARSSHHHPPAVHRRRPRRPPCVFARASRLTAFRATRTASFVPRAIRSTRARSSASRSRRRRRVRDPKGIRPSVRPVRSSAISFDAAPASVASRRVAPSSRRASRRGWFESALFYRSSARRGFIHRTGVVLSPSRDSR